MTSWSGNLCSTISKKSQYFKILQNEQKDFEILTLYRDGVT